MTMAGYDPYEAPKFWERMTEGSGGQEPPEFLSTHPSHSTRVKDLQGWIPEALTYKK
jgi:predicted Zn-dependent protease